MIRTAACLGCGEPLALADKAKARKYCSALCRQPLSKIGYANCLTCGNLFTVRGIAKTCSSACSAKYRKARIRNRDHIRRATYSDIAPEHEIAMRRKARKCPMSGCGVRLTDKLGLPNSKHLDHIIPINPIAGGTHTHGNVRIICAACNLKRPKDGSDYSGPVTLWAQGEIQVRRPDRRTGTSRKSCRKGLHPWTPDNIIATGGQRRCKACLQATRRRTESKRHPMRPCTQCGTGFAAPGSTLMCPECTLVAVRQAMFLRMADGLTWAEIARQVGYGSGTGIRDAVARIGTIPPEPGRTVAPKPLRHCQCGAASYRDGRCADCIAVAARRAVHLRTQERWTLRMIADELGYSSITTVTNLMKTVTSTR